MLEQRLIEQEVLFSSTIAKLVKAMEKMDSNMQSIETRVGQLEWNFMDQETRISSALTNLATGRKGYAMKSGIKQESISVGKINVNVSMENLIQTH